MKTALITGATGGIGYEAAKALATQGFLVVVAGRNAARTVAVAAEITANGGNAQTLVVDMSSLDSVRAAATEFASRFTVLDILINNAGIFAGKRELSADGHESTWATNVLGLVALTRELLPLLEAAVDPRVINISSTAHRAGRLRFDDFDFERERYRSWAAYAQSKLALVLYTREFARRNPKITAVAMHPGAIATGIWRALPSVVRRLLARVLPPADVGAAPIVALATASDLRAASGHYFDKFADIAPSRAALDPIAAARLWDYLESASVPRDTSASA